MPPDYGPGVDPAICENTVLSGIRYWLNTIFLNIEGIAGGNPWMAGTSPAMTAGNGNSKNDG
jgi:hypothetical protein